MKTTTTFEEMIEAATRSKSKTASFYSARNEMITLKIRNGRRLWTINGERSSADAVEHYFWRHYGV